MKKMIAVAAVALVMGCHSEKLAERPTPELMDISVERLPGKADHSRLLRASLQRRIDAMEDLRDSLSSAHRTKFAVSRVERRRLEDGVLETVIRLKADGSRDVPEFSVRAKAKKGAKIRALEIRGKDLENQIFSFERSSDETLLRKSIFSMPAEDISVRIETEGQPSGLEIQIDPLE